MARRAAAVAALLASLALVPSAGAGRQSTITVRDPDGGSPWTARVTQPGARTCIRLAHGSDRKPRQCERLSRSRVFMYSVRTDTAADPRATRTLAVAVFGSSVVRAQLRSPDGTVTFRRGRRRGPGVLFAVIAGRVDRPDLRVTVRRRGGGTMTVTSSTPTGVTVADPRGGAAWRTSALAASGGRACVRWERVPGRFEAPPAVLLGPVRCGNGASDLPVAVADRTDDRVVVTGLAGADTSKVVLTGAGSPLSLSVDRASRAFLAVLPPAVDPAALRLRYESSGATRERSLDVPARR